ncbi:MAG: hypothetical protein COC24_019275 [Alphaproteobacteria bacterium]|nr:hypothetical protein [Alphaproteobacteria bacterium]
MNKSVEIEKCADCGVEVHVLDLHICKASIDATIKKASKDKKIFIVTGGNEPDDEVLIFSCSAEQAAIEWGIANLSMGRMDRIGKNLIVKVCFAAGHKYIGLSVEIGAVGGLFKIGGVQAGDEIHPCFEETRSQIIHECVSKTATFTFEREHVYPFDDLEEEYLREYLIEGVLPKK